MSGMTDAWADEVARGLVLDWADRGIEASLSHGRIRLSPASAVLPAEFDLLRTHRAAVLLLLLACDERTLVRLARLRAGESSPPALLPGVCRDCGDSLPPAVRWGSCGWCATARRQHTRAPLPESLLEVFPVELVGRYARGGSLDVGAGSRVPRGRGESGGLFTGAA
jgi:hypothetical protein